MSTGADVPVAPVALTAAGVQSGRPVRGGHAQWARYASQANHLVGLGAALVPWSAVQITIAPSGVETLRYRVVPRYAATHRIWRFSLYTTAGAGRSFGVFTDPTGDSTAFDVVSVYPSIFEHIEEIGARSSSEGDLAPKWEVDAASAKGVTIVAVACFEVTRDDLELDALDYGSNVPSCDVGMEIRAGSDGLSVGSVSVVASDQALAIARRPSLFQFARGTTNALSTTSAGYTAVFTNGASPLLLDRFLYAGETVAPALVRVRARSGAGTTGNIRFTMDSGDTLVLAVTSGMAATWLTGTVDVDTDYFTDDVRGRRRTPGDLCLIEWQRTGGANTVLIESISILGRSS